MGIRRKGPALLELVTGRDVARVAPTPRPAVAIPPPRPAPKPEPRLAPPPPLGADAAPTSLWPAAGKSVRVPVGYLFLAIALGVALVFGGYFAGYSRRGAIEKARLATSQVPIPGPEDDPLNRPLANPPETPARTGAQPTLSKPGGGGLALNTPPKGQPVNPSGAAKPSGEPRSPGMNYFILADRISPEEAQKAADFLSSHGLAAAVVSSNNAKFRRVIATRGFAGADVNGPEATRLKAEAARLGGLYKTQERGPVDFAKPYPEKFQP